jgi:hypothetical protein
MSDATDTTATTADPAQALPSVFDLTVGQYAGWNCVWCGKAIGTGGRLVGVARGRDGAHILDVEVYAGPCCP